MKKLTCFLFAWILLTGVVWADSIKIPIAAPFTGPLASFGEGMKNGALLKGEEINAAGGINGKTVKIILEDELCDPKEAAMVATKLANDPKVSVVVGTFAVLLPLRPSPFTGGAKLPAISPASTNVTIGKMSPYYFSKCLQR